MKDSKGYNTQNSIFAIEPSIMESKRQSQVAETLRRNFSQVLMQEGPLIYDDALVTVTRVVVSPDLSQAKIYLSIYNTDNKQAVLLALDANHHRLYQALFQRVRRHLRRTPEFTLYLDDTLDEIDRLDALFKKIKSQGHTDSDE